MEILILVLLYYLSQNPDFADSVKPIMEQLKGSEKMLSFLKDLSAFSKSFQAFNGESSQDKQHTEQPSQNREETKDPQSPTKGIADTFIQSILDDYFKKQGPTQ